MFTFPDIYRKLIVLKIERLATHSYFHRNISRSAVRNISLVGPFPPSPISNSTKTTAKYIFLYISSVRMVHNSQNVSAGLQKLTFADLQYILWTVSSIMYLKPEKCPKVLE